MRRHAALSSATHRLAALLLAAAVHTASADVVVLQDGSREEGKVTQANAATVSLLSVSGEVAIPRAKIARVEDESDSADQVRLGRGFLTKKDEVNAADAFRKALDLDPKNAEAETLLKSAEAALEDRARAGLAADTTKVEQGLAQARALVGQKKFEQAADTLKSLNMGFGTARAGDVRKAFADTYVTWAADRMDRQDPSKASELLQNALRLDPGNERARKMLVSTFDGDPGKLKEVAEFHKGSVNPADIAKRADALFRLRRFDEALPEYLGLAKAPGIDGDLPRERVGTMYTALHETAAQKGDFENAAKFFQQYLDFKPAQDPTPLAQYQYMIQRNKTDMNDPAGRAALAATAESLGLPDTARREFLNVLTIAPTQPDAVAGATRFARVDLSEAIDLYGKADYDTAIAKANQVIETYPMLPGVVKEAEELRTRGQLEAKKVAQTRRQQAVALAERGNQYYVQAQSYAAAMVSTNFDRTIRAFSPKQEAIKFYGWALQAWRTALATDPSLGDPASYDLRRRIADAQMLYNNLANPVAPSLPRVVNYGQTAPVN